METVSAGTIASSGCLIWHSWSISPAVRMMMCSPGPKLNQSCRPLHPSSRGCRRKHPATDLQTSRIIDCVHRHTTLACADAHSIGPVLQACPCTHSISICSRFQVCAYVLAIRLLLHAIGTWPPHRQIFQRHDTVRRPMMQQAHAACVAYSSKSVHSTTSPPLYLARHASIC